MAPPGAGIGGFTVRAVPCAGFDGLASLPAFPCSWLCRGGAAAGQVPDGSSQADPDRFASGLAPERQEKLRWRRSAAVRAARR